MWQQRRERGKKGIIKNVELKTRVKRNGSLENADDKKKKKSKNKINK